ncbi:quinone-dependent dihydroorotate dehydrogenase [Roseospirillum parvum]|uniref:Dihydroorotate dehydrogenase (quinone) n=1 Tax=Roseospirillum parvum TaxID=83401 RepID=A0A1G8D1D8_9PROT|nr:quinone-dependent dihydroorotate dehydrogenase [Roseospirillum parvum]SDH51501.1 dihydroorotate dehydrogenase [Roseospirillum parvum]
MSLYRLAWPLIERLEPENAHRLAIKVLASGFGGRQKTPDDPALAVEVFGRRFPNPVGLAAGFDKDAECPDACLRLGFAFTEVGAVTPRPQAGNAKPRLFRLPENMAVINRMGFNNQGLEAMTARLGARRGPSNPNPGPVGVNLGVNRDSEDAPADYAAGARALAPLADFLTVNVSSPNTAGLRALQSRANLTTILAATREARDAACAEAGCPTPPLLLKIAPDLTEEDLADIVATALEDGGPDGLIISNTTIARPPQLNGPHRAEPGGLSGRPLFEASTALLSEVYRRTGGKLPLIGVGGIEDGATAYAKILAGASLIQLYTALVFKGPELLPALKHDLAERLKADGFETLQDAIGAGAD